MEIFISKFLEKSDFLIDDEKKWNWLPKMKLDFTNATSSTTNCGCTRVRGGTDVGSDDEDKD